MANVRKRSKGEWGEFDSAAPRESHESTPTILHCCSMMSGNVLRRPCYSACNAILSQDVVGPTRSAKQAPRHERQYRSLTFSEGTSCCRDLRIQHARLLREMVGGALHSGVRIRPQTSFRHKKVRRTSAKIRSGSTHQFITDTASTGTPSRSNTKNEPPSPRD